MKLIIALAVAAAAVVGCAEEAPPASHESRTLEQMLALGANRYLIDKYEHAGRETGTVLQMLELVGRDGPERHPSFVKDLMARGFALDERTSRTMRSWDIDHRSM